MKEIFKHNFRSVLSLVLVAAMVLMFAGCGGKIQDEVKTEPATNQQEVQEKSFTFEVIELDGTKKEFTVKYGSEKTVGEALVNEGLISGSDSQYGLMVETVNGQKYTYDEDKVYDWKDYLEIIAAILAIVGFPIEMINNIIESNKPTVNINCSQCEVVISNEDGSITIND